MGHGDLGVVAFVAGQVGGQGHHLHGIGRTCPGGGHVDAEHVHELDDGIPSGAAGRSLLGRQRGRIGHKGVHIAHEGEDLAQGRRGIEVVVHGLGEVGPQHSHAIGQRRCIQHGRKLALGGFRDQGRLAAGRARLQQPVEGAHGVLDAREGRVGLVHALLAEHKRAAVVALQHEHAQGRRAHLLQHLVQQQEVVQRLRHLLGLAGLGVGDLQHARVHPVVGKGAVAGALGLGALVLVVREHQVGPAAVNVEGQAQVLLGHGRALDVPTGATRAPGRGPGRFAGLGRLPQGEVQLVALAVFQALAVGSQLAVTAFRLVHVAARELPVTRVGAHIEVHVALGRIGMSALDKALDKRDHGIDLFSGLRANVGVLHAGGPHILDEQARVLLGHLGGGAVLLAGALDDLVVHVGHVLHKGDLEAAPAEVAADHVEGDEGARIADVDAVVHRGAAHVHGHLPRLYRLEIHLLAQARIVQLNHE